MSAVTEALARFYRMQAHAHNAHADYFEARGGKNDTALVRNYRLMAQDYFRMAHEIESELTEIAA